MVGMERNGTSIPGQGSLAAEKLECFMFYHIGYKTVGNCRPAIWSDTAISTIGMGTIIEPSANFLNLATFFFPSRI